MGLFRFLRTHFSEFASTDSMHDKFELPNSNTRMPSGLSRKEFEFRSKFLQEELNEFKEAYENNDDAKMLDALYDLVIVAHGTACFMGVSKELWRDGFDAVVRANRKKKRGKKNTRPDSAGFDLIKPLGWKAPDAEIRSLWANAVNDWYKYNY